MFIKKIYFTVKSTCESDTDSDQSDYETTIELINLIFNFNLDLFILNIF
jgi:hypothetical protein